MKFEFTDQEVQIIGEALGDAPFKKSASVLATMQKQINDQKQEIKDDPSNS